MIWSSLLTGVSYWEEAAFQHWVCTKVWKKPKAEPASIYVLCLALLNYARLDECCTWASRNVKLISCYKHKVTQCWSYQGKLTLLSLGLTTKKKVYLDVHLIISTLFLLIVNNAFWVLICYDYGFSKSSFWRMDFKKTYVHGPSTWRLPVAACCSLHPYMTVWCYSLSILFIYTSNMAYHGRAAKWCFSLWLSEREAWTKSLLANWKEMT